MSEIELAKCPFCDVELKRWDYMPQVFFEHPYNGCILSGKKVLESEHDIKAWNTRKPMERIIERLEEERKKSLQLWDGNSRYKGYSKAIKIIEEECGISE